MAVRGRGLKAVKERNAMNAVTELTTNSAITGKDLERGSTATPFSTFFWAGLKEDWATAEAQFADNIEWDMMPNNQIRKGKADVFVFLKASKNASQKDPIPISNRADKEWGVWEYWNVGTIDEGIVEFAKQSKWPFPADVRSIIGKKYKVAVCFIYHINPKGQIDLLREYTDTASVLSQFK
jgi:hypothetical protein